ncbi:MAG TPA: hypothetical protein VH637_07325 [Streptosporangiaceae bacterium]
MSIERPEADSAEQDQDAAPGGADQQRADVPFEADAADAADQGREVEPGDDDYR